MSIAMITAEALATMFDVDERTIRAALADANVRDFGEGAYVQSRAIEALKTKLDRYPVIYSDGAGTSVTIR